ncbi:MAG: hypothetical protein IPN72_20380 [Saprospiraceae bacterium]|nr:hypothetical protein [Saprospiraceae bacterium]
MGPDGYYHYSSSDCYQNYFENNTASVSGGALVKKNGQTATFWVNNVFKNNNAPEGSSIVVINSISFRFNFNTLVGTEVSTSNSGIYVESSYGTIYFCILWNLGSSELILNNSPSFLVLRSLVKKAPVLPSYTGYDLIIGLEPKFLNYPIDLHLSSTSPCINYEYASLADGTAISGDFDNTARGKGNAYDMGAYEFDQAQCPVISRVYIDAAANGSNMGPDWSNAFKFIEDGLNFANACPNVNEVWIAEGLYKPDIISVREHSLNVKRSLSIYGGFQGFENDIGERVLDSNYATIISGDIGMPNEVTDNTNNIFYLTDANIQVLLDGLTLQDAFNNGNDRLGGAAGMQRGKLTVQNCTFRNNTANNGGALYFSEFSNARILNCRFIGNKAVQSGGAIYSRCDSLIIFESSFYSNFAGSSGGAIYSYNSDGVEFDSLDLKYNNAAVGGGIYFGSGNGTFNKIHSLSNSAIVGGGIQFAFATIEINSSSFTSDNSNTGGAISSSSSQINLSEINFSLNKASKGVALHMLNTTILLNSCKFNLNTGSTPTTTGDVVSLNNSIFVGDDLEVFNNQNLSSITAQNSKLTLINSNIHHNQEFANSADQLFELFYTVLKFENVFVTDNQFSTNFSFLGDGSGDTVLFKNTHILRNTGNLFIVTTIEDFKLVNSVVANNLGPSYITLGSFVLGTKAAMINSVVSGNRNNTSLINLVQMYDSELMIGNCIINDNTNSGISTMNFSINAYQSIIQNGSALGPTILDVDPMFVDPASGNFNLQMGSPAINTGSPLNAPATDILGNPRPQGGFYDMGIYEYAIPANFVFNGALDTDWHKGGNWDTGFPPPNVFNGNIIFNASATKIDGLGFDIKNPGTLTLGNGVIVEIK